MFTLIEHLDTIILNIKDTIVIKSTEHSLRSRTTKTSNLTVPEIKGHQITRFRKHSSEACSRYLFQTKTNYIFSSTVPSAKHLTISTNSFSELTQRFSQRFYWVFWDQLTTGLNLVLVLI